MKRFIRLIGIGLVVLTLVSLITAVPARADVTVTPASGGTAISADNFVSGTWTSLGPIIITEGANADIPEKLLSATLVLKAPSGFEFNTAPVPSITGLGGDIDVISIVISSTTITVTLSTDSSANKIDTITIGAAPAIQVRPTAGTPLASGQIYRPTTGGGTAGAIAGITTTANPDGSGGTNFGTLTEVAGAAAKVKVETAANGSGTVVPAQNLTAGSPLTVYSVTRDQFDNYVGNTAASWSFSTKTGGVADGDLVAAGDSKSATMTGALIGTGVIHAAIGGLTSTDSGTITVVAAGVNTLTVVQQPTTTDAGAVIAPPVTVKAVDQFGNVIAGQSVAASLQTGTGTLSGTTPQVTNASGIATFDDLSINEVGGDKVLRFTADIKFIDSDTFTIISVSITITPPTGGTDLVLAPETSNQSLITSTGSVTSGVNFDVTAKDKMADDKSGNAGKLIEYDAGGIVAGGKVLTNAVTVWSSHTNKVASEITLTASDQSVIVNAALATDVDLLLIVEQDTAAGDESLTESGHYYKIVITFTASEHT